MAYTRLSSLDQRAGRQLDGIAVDRTFTDTASGKNTQRPQLAALIRFVREGGTVIVHSMDRLARNLDDLRRLVRELTNKAYASSSSKSSSPSPATTPPWRTCWCRSWAPFAEFEWALIGQRQREGIALAKMRGAYRGRRRSLSEEQVRELRPASRRR